MQGKIYSNVTQTLSPSRSCLHLRHDSHTDPRAVEQSEPALVIYPQNGPKCDNNHRHLLLHRRHTHRMSLTHFSITSSTFTAKSLQCESDSDDFLLIHLSCHATETCHVCMLHISQLHVHWCQTGSDDSQLINWPKANPQELRMCLSCYIVSLCL